MAIKKRFKKKDIEIKSLRDKDEKKELAKLTLLKSDIKDKTDYASHTVVDLNEIKRFSTESGSDSENYQRKLICYKKINELFQSNSLSLFNLMKASVEIICTGVDAEGGSLWVSEENIIQCRVAIGPNAQKLMGKKMEYGQGILGWVAQNNKSQVIYDTSLDERFQNNSSAKSLMATPMAYENKVIGLIEVINKKDENGKFSDSDLNFIEHISTLLGMYIKTTRVLREQDSLIKRMSNFADLHEKFSSTIELDELLVLVLQRAINFLEAEVGSIWLVEDHGEGIECSYAVGPTKDKVQ
jgi:GAF domain-containing protein